MALDELVWRYAVKKFDETRKLALADFDLLVEAVRLTPSSFGLQPYKLIHGADQKVRLQLI